MLLAQHIEVIKMTKHGLTIGIERINNNFYLSFKAIGTLTHQDYEKITPMIDSALAGVKDAKINAFFDMSELDGWEIRAAWDDFKLGLKHGSEFNKVAILGNKDWQKWAAKIGSWFIAGEIKTFEQAEDALAWLENE
jgi:hypothetical protein